MNPNRIVHARLSLANDKIDLGRASFQEIIKRLIDQYANRRYQGDKLRLVLEISDDPLSLEPLLSREAQLEAEMLSLAVPDSEEAFPGVTFARVHEVMASPIYEQYNHLCEPANRIGVPDSMIQSIKDQYSANFPDCIEHFPLWRN